jgi:hypothetical protein
VNQYESIYRVVLTRTFILAFLAATLCCAHNAAAKKVYVSDGGLGNYLHHKLGIHDYLYGPGGVVPRYTGLPAQPTSHQLMNPRVIVIHRATCEGLNIRVTVPSEAWKNLDPVTVGSRTSFMLARRNPDITISLAGERIGVEAKETNRTLLAKSQEKMKELPGAVLLPGERQLSGQNIQGIAYQAKAELDGRVAHYSIWVASRNGYNYKLAVYGEQKHKPAIDAAMRNFVGNMRQLDTKRIAHAERKKAEIAYLYQEATEKAPPKEPRAFDEAVVK